MSHVILLGDSIFDNARYVSGGPTVIEQLRRALPDGWHATLLAVDGSVAAHVIEQLECVPADASHLVVSAGGNNALENIDWIRHGSARSVAEVLSRLAQIRADFQQEYRTMLESVLARGLSTIVCTVYDAIPRLASSEQTGLCLFNEVILREAFRAAVPVVDLRLICTEASDYAMCSPIEPSVSGGGKIARSIGRAVVASSSSTLGTWIIT